MTNVYKVQYTRFFEEFGCEDVDTTEFDNLSDAYEFYEEKKNDERVQLWCNNDRLM